jgi:glycosyltransferase involved in cell wall biosynthesis
MISQFNPKISVIIPVYNGSNYLKEAIDSVLAQTYKNIEIIVVNDGSNDGKATEVIAQSFGNDIKYFYKENGGVATALNFGIRQANGDYISWLSHDDLYYSNKIMRQVEYLRQQASKDIIVFSDFDVIDYINNTNYTKKVDDNFQFTTYTMLTLLFSSSLHACSMLIPKSCFENIGFFSETLITTQDYDYLFKLFRNNYIFKYIEEPLMVTRHHKEQGTLQLLDYHIKELIDLYSWATELFVDEIRKLSVGQIDELANLMNRRGLNVVYEILLEIKTVVDNIDKLQSGIPAIWLYWENKDNKNTPVIINYCHETIEKNNKNDFLIIKTTPRNIKYYLSDLDDTYLLFEKIAHKADYLRFNLLYRYGGIWLDSDFICFKSLKPMLDKIYEFGFVYTGYLTDDGKIFPIIHFLGSKKHNKILLNLINKVHDILNEKVKNGIQPAWDEIGGYALQPLLTNENSYRYDTKVFSRIDIHGHGQREMFLPIKISKYNEDDLFGQMLCYSVHTDFFDIMGEDILNMDCYLSDVLNNNLSVEIESSKPDSAIKICIQKIIVKAKFFLSGKA